MRDSWNKFKKWASKNKKHIGIVIVLMFFLIPFYVRQTHDDPKPQEIEYTAFLKMTEEKQVKEVDILLSSPTFTFKDINDVTYETDNPKIQTFKDDLLKKGIDVNEVDANAGKAWQDTLSRLFSLVLYIVIFIVAMSYYQKRMGGNKNFEFSPEDNEDDKKDSKNPKVKGQEKDKKPLPKKITFAHIAGNDEAKEDMHFLVDFLKNPTKYGKNGAKLPKGVIFYGPPGTGKTLFAKAIAGEAGVPFFSVSGSDFVEMYVGLGAKRVRDLFEQARKKAPCIIFIDEIDAIGGSRDRESHSEQRQTLNAILKEMDGFDSNKGIIVIGATNRLSDLDSAFIRPGRFDKHIAIDLPDQKSRLEILKIHARNKPLAEDVNLEELSKMTIGLSGAFLESIMNEAAILATTRNQEEIKNSDIDDAYYKVLMKGHKKKGGDKRSNDEIELVAWHEAGHALAAKLLTNQEVPKVTIVPSTSGAGGVAFIIPKKTGLLSKEELIQDIKISYAGRAAEFILLGSEMKITTGASSDIQNATSKIKQMITQVGMSETYGMINLDMFENRSGSTNQDVLKEASDMAKTLYAETIDLLKQNKHLLEAIAKELMVKESLNEDQLNAIIASHIKDSHDTTTTEKEAS